MEQGAVSRAEALFGLDPASIRCPYPIFAGLREQAPVVWFDALEAFVVTKYELVLEVLRQPEVFSSRHATGPVQDRQVKEAMKALASEDADIGAMMAERTRHGVKPVLVHADPPVHARQRALVNRAFRPEVVRALEPTIVQVANDLIDSFVDRGSAEFVRDFAVPLPMTVIAIALGVASDRMEDFKRWSDGMTSGIGRPGISKDDVAEIVRSRSQMEAFLRDEIASREVHAADDLLSQIVQSRIDGERLSGFEVMDMAVQFLLAGNETTAMLITQAMLYLTRRPDLVATIRRDPELIPRFVEEVLRLEPPSQGLYRTANSDYVLGGVPIAAGSALWLAFAAGNRDPDHFVMPDECTLDQQRSAPHLGFGLGPHFCLGAGLARAEGRVAIERMLARLDDFALSVDESVLPMDPTFIVHRIRELPLTFRRRVS